MKRTRLLLSLSLLATLALTISCTADLPTGPEIPAPSPSLIGSLLGPTGLLKCTPLPYATATATIGRLGGVLKVGPHKLTVPPGALTAPVTITAVAPSETVNRVQFTPAGLQFEVPAALTMSYANCNLLGLLLPKRIAYVNGGLDILYYLLSIDNLLAKKVTGKLNHFSSYAIAW
jgi:hypothetical protein